MYKFKDCEKCQCAICTKYSETCWGNCPFCIGTYNDSPSSFFKKEEPQCKDFEQKKSLQEELFIQMNTTLNLCANQLAELKEALKRIQFNENKN